MFTGIIEEILKIDFLEVSSDIMRLGISVPNEWLSSLSIGGSVAVNGVCLTITTIENSLVYFDLIPETYQLTTFRNAALFDQCNVERAATLGAQIGGHLTSGHIIDTATIIKIKKSNKHQINTILCDKKWMKYILHKGFVTLDGASLTVVNPSPDGMFDIHLIPETLNKTLFGIKRENELINLEIDPQTQATVDTVERIITQQYYNYKN